MAYEVAATGDFGAATGAGTATFLANSATVQVSVATTGDGAQEAHGSVTVTLTADTGANPAYLLGDPSTATAAVDDDDDSPATGSVTITGTAAEGETLTADTSGLADADGLANAGYVYQWVRTPSGGSDADISGATSQTYVPVFADVGATLKVRVTVTDDESHEATFESAATAAVAATARPFGDGGPGRRRDGGRGRRVHADAHGRHGGGAGRGLRGGRHRGTSAPRRARARRRSWRTAPRCRCRWPRRATAPHEAHGSVTVTLTADTGADPAYLLGAPSTATAAVLDDDDLTSERGG